MYTIFIQKTKHFWWIEKLYNILFKELTICLESCDICTIQIYGLNGEIFTKLQFYNL